MFDNINTYCTEVDKVYIVDNSDKKRNIAEEELGSLENCEYISLRYNRGIACALNVGMVKVMAEHYQWVLTMD